MKNIRAIIRKSGSVALASAMVLSSSGVMTYAATSDVQNTISAIEQSYGIDSAKYAQDITDTAAANANTIPTTTDIMADVTDTTGITTTKQNEQTEIDAETEYTTPELSADVYEGTDEPQADTVSSGKWGTCNWNINDGVLTISGGVASGSVKGDSGYMVSPWDSYKRSIKKVVIEDTITFENNASLAHLFDGWIFLVEIDGLDKFDTSNVTDMSYMFFESCYLATLDVSKFNTGNVTDMSYMFGGRSRYGYLTGMERVTTIDVSNFDTSNVTDMSYMFGGCRALTTIDVSNFDTSKVTYMSGMFSGCSALTTIDVSNFDTSKVTYMSSMFSGCNSLTTIDVSNFDTGNVTEMGSMFYGCSSLTTIDLSNFDTSNVTHMGGMFDGCKSLTTINVSNFDTGNVTEMGCMFYGCSSLTTIDLSKLDLTNSDIRSYHTNSSGEQVTVMANYLSGESGSLKKIIMPSALGKEENIKTILNDMYTIASSWTDKTANKVYAEKPDTLIAGHTYVVTGSEYDKTELSINATKKENGNKITFTANANGGDGKYTYKFLVYNKTTNSWAKLQDFSDKNTFTWTKGNAGDRYFYVDVKDSTGKTVRSAALNVNTAGNTKPLTVSAAKTENGNKITFTANANGGNGKYTYKFLVYNKTTNSWAKLQDFSDKNTFTWTKGNAGDRYFYVDVKDSTGKTVRSAALNVNTAGTVSKPTSSLTASTEKVNVGGKVTLTAKAGAGSGKYTYKFLIYNPSTNQWAKLQDFSANSTFTWTAGSAGNRQFYVDVKDSNGNVTRSKVVNVAVDKAQSVNKLTVKATASTTANKVGENVTFTAAANGGTGKYTYKFLVYNKTTNQWAKLQDFGVASKLTWTAGSAAERQFFVDVKDSNGTVVRSSVMNVKTTK